jgi:hypothetical protein
MASVQALVGRNAGRRGAKLWGGVQITLMVMRALRLKNSRSMRIGRYVVADGKTCSLEISGEEMKNHRPIDTSTPPLPVPALEEYFGQVPGRHRRWQARRKCTVAVILVAAASEISIRQKIKKWTGHAFGLPITPQLFRDCTATSHAVHAPELVQFAHQGLGNTYAVMEKHCNLARVVEAGHHDDAALERLLTD